MRIGIVLPSGTSLLRVAVPQEQSRADGFNTKSGPVVVPADHLLSETITTVARQVEEYDLDSVWAVDALSRGRSTPDPLTVLTAAAAVTTRIELGTGVLQLPVRETVDLAHRVLTTYLISGRRLLLGVGIGSHVADFAATGHDFEARAARFRQQLRDMTALWSGERVGQAQLQPWGDTRGGPPVLIGSWHSMRAIAAAAKKDVGWIGSGAMTSWTKSEAGVRAFLEAGGRRAVLTQVGFQPDGDDEELDEAGPITLRCSDSQAVKRIERLADVGFTDVALFVNAWDDAVLAKAAALRARFR